MDYNGRIFLNMLPNVLTESRIINGREQTCVIIPVEDNQLRQGKWGNWILPVRMRAEPPNAKGISHTLALQFRNTEELEKAHQSGITRRTIHLGTATAFDPPNMKEKADTNESAVEELCGEIILSDIPKSLIYKNKKTNKRFISHLRLKSLTDDGTIWTGSVSVDDIPRHHILEYPDSGKKYIKVKFKKLKRADIYMNTHILVLDAPDGSEIEVGKFREFRKNGEIVRNEVSPEDIHDTPVNMRTPESIDGLRF